MTAKKLSELKSKFENNEGSINDLGIILCDLFESMSSHFKEAKSQINTLNENQNHLFEFIDEIKESLNPVYTIIQSDE